MALFIAGSFVLTAESAKDKSKNNQNTVICGQWKIRNNVKKLYDTPLGVVYKFQISKFFDFSNTWDKEYLKNFDNPNFNSLQFTLFDKESDYRKRMKRFLVLDFKLRTFPAEDRSKNPVLYFTLTRSNLDARSISKYLDINGIAYYHTKYGVISAIVAPVHSRYPIVKHPPRKCFFAVGFENLPYYEIVSFRAIFDTSNLDGFTSVNLNGDKFVANSNEKCNDIAPFRSFGICIQDGEATRLDKKAPPPRMLLEISNPTVRMLDTEDELRKLEPLVPIAYPYSGYSGEWKEVRRSRNPDAVYAYAMRLIDTGEDLPEAVKLLKNAASDDHIFAMYQLGVCYYRGIGVEPDRKEALRWLKKATQYDFSDAWALYGLLQIHCPSPSPYINASEQINLRKALNQIDNRHGKHDNSVLGVMFGNLWSCNANNDYSGSPKLETWALAIYGANIYYMNNAPPEITDQAKAKKENKKISAIRPASLSDDKRKSNQGKIDFNIFYDRRIKYWPFSTPLGIIAYHIQKDGLNRAIEQGYSPAMLYKGRLLLALPFLSQCKHAPFILKQIPLAPLSIDKTNWTMTEALAAALPLFEKGAQAGNPECELEAMFCRAQKGELKINDFTQKRDVSLADYPLYYLLRYAVENPSAPGVREFLDRKYEKARNIWRSEPSARNRFLLGAEALYQFFNYGFDSAYYRIYYGDINDVTEAFALLDQAAKEGIVPAMYLVGKQYLDGQRNKHSEMSLEGNLSSAQIKIGLDLLALAAKAGHLKAEYLLVKNEAERQHSFKEEWLDRLKPLRAADYGDAWLLTAEICSHKPATGNDWNEELMKLYEKAAQLGSLRAWYRLGALHKKNKDDDQATRCWGEFVKRDRVARTQDPLDIYYQSCCPWNMVLTGQMLQNYIKLFRPEATHYIETY